MVEQSKFTSSHLLGFVLKESAYSIPFSNGLSSGQMKALPVDIQSSDGLVKSFVLTFIFKWPYSETLILSDQYLS